MTRRPRANLMLGALCVLGAAFAAGVWVPLDTDTGLIETVRRRVTIGDALAPTVALAVTLLGGVLLLGTGSRAAEQPALTRANLAFLAGLLMLLFAAFTVMRWAGPLAVTLAGEEAPFRLLRDTAPWKWIGFFLGGAGLVAGLILMLERRITVRALLIGAVAAILLIALFDLPFDDLLLPPNGDV